MRLLIHVILSSPCFTQLLFTKQWLLGEGRMVTNAQRDSFQHAKIQRDSSLGHRVAWEFEQDDFFMGIVTARK